MVQRFRRSGVPAAALHGDRSQSQRQRALDDFAKGRVTTLVATDVAARGIHVDDVGVVVHFDPPETDKDYVHRSGRTGRAGADGLVVTLVPGHRVDDVRTIQRALGLPRGVADVALDALSTGGARIAAVAPGTSEQGRSSTPPGGARSRPRKSHTRGSERPRSRGGRRRGAGGQRVA